MTHINAYRDKAKFNVKMAAKLGGVAAFHIYHPDKRDFVGGDKAAREEWLGEIYDLARAAAHFAASALLFNWTQENTEGRGL